MLSGFLFEIGNMPGWLQTITYIIPARYFVASLQTVFLTGDVWAQFVPNILAMLAVGAGFFILVARNTHKSMDLLTCGWGRKSSKRCSSISSIEQTRITFIGPPLLQLCLLSYAATMEVRNVDIAVVNDDTGRASHELVERIGAASFVDEVIVADRAETIAQLVDRRDVLVGIHIAADFSRDVAAGRPATVQVLIDGRRGNSGQIALSYLQNIVKDYGAELTGAPGAGIPQTEIRNWFNENLTYLWFVVPGMAGILVMFTTLVVTALSIPKEREQGTFDQLLVSPSSPIEIVIAKSMPAFIIAIGQAALMITVGSAGVPYPAGRIDTAAVAGGLAVRILAGRHGPDAVGDLRRHNSRRFSACSRSVIR